MWRPPTKPEPSLGPGFAGTHPRIGAQWPEAASPPAGAPVAALMPASTTLTPPSAHSAHTTHSPARADAPAPRSAACRVAGKQVVWQHALQRRWQNDGIAVSAIPSWIIVGYAAPAKRHFATLCGRGKFRAWQPIGDLHHPCRAADGKTAWLPNREVRPILVHGSPLATIRGSSSPIRSRAYVPHVTTCAHWFARLAPLPPDLPNWQIDDAGEVTVQVVANCTEMQCECNDNCKLKAQELVVICA